jgi:hypothetical protein
LLIFTDPSSFAFICLFFDSRAGGAPLLLA